MIRSFVLSRYVFRDGLSAVLMVDPKTRREEGAQVWLRSRWRTALVLCFLISVLVLINSGCDPTKEEQEGQGISEMDNEADGSSAKEAVCKKDSNLVLPFPFSLNLSIYFFLSLSSILYPSPQPLCSIYLQ